MDTVVLSILYAIVNLNVLRKYVLVFFSTSHCLVTLQPYQVRAFQLQHCSDVNALCKQEDLNVNEGVYINSSSE